MIAGEIFGERLDRTPGLNRVDRRWPHARDLLKIRPAADGGVFSAEAYDAISHFRANLGKQPEFFFRRVVQSQFHQRSTPPTASHAGFSSVLGIALALGRFAHNNSERCHHEQRVNDRIV